MSAAGGKQTNNGGQDDEGEEEDDEVGDLVSAINYNTINYNTISSMAVLKEILGAQDSPEDADWFQHYFLRHVNRLPSRSQFPGRRLSECKEEDEHVENNLRSPVTDDQLSSTNISAKSTPPISPPSHHRDKHFFDVNLVEMKSQASSTSTLDYDSMDEVWVKRYDPETSKRRAELGSQPLPTTLDDTDGQCISIHRPRSGTWSKGGSAPVLLPAVVAALAKSKKASIGVERRQSGDDILAKGTPKVQLSKNKTQQTQTQQTQSQNAQKKVSPKPRSGQSPSHARKTSTLIDVFRPRSKSDAASKKNNTIMGHMKNSIQQTLKSPGSSARNSISGSNSSTETIEFPNSVPPPTRNRYKQTAIAARPRAGSDSANTKGAVSKMMDLFRHRSQSAVSAEDKRKARAVNINHTNLAQGALLRRSSLDPETRRLSLGTISNSRKNSDGFLDPTHAAILFRDSRGLPVADPFLEKVKFKDLTEDDSQIYPKFFRFHKTYDLIPTSAKLVVFDTQLIVKKAFFALVVNCVRAAPLWDNKRQKFVGMLTITDFIRILQKKYYSSSSSSMEELEEHKLDTWRNELQEERPQELISIGPDMSLYFAIQTLVNYRIHRLPVIDPISGDVLYIVTHKRILRFLLIYIRIHDLPKPAYLSKTLGELKVGTYDNIETVSEDTSIILALKKFVERRVSALPMVDHEGRLIDIFAKFDVINLAAERTYNNLDISLKQANEHRSDWFEGVQKCLLTDTLFNVMEKIVRAEVHRLVIVDTEDKVIGILSLSDILHYLVLRPTEGAERLLKTKDLFENNVENSEVLNSVDEPLLL